MLSDYSKREVRAAFRLHHLAVLAGFLATSVGLSFLFPGMPGTVYRFFLKVCAMNNWTEIILINDYMGVFFALYWVGVIDLLRVYTLPKEEGYLELLLSKPLGRTRYLFARALPAFGVIAGMGIVMTLFLPLKIALINGAADLRPSDVFCAGIVITAVTLTLLALLNLMFLFSPETYYSVALAFVVFMFTVLPGSIFMYRPDVFQGQATLDLILFPANLLWHGELLPKITPIILLVAAAISILSLVGGGRRLKKLDIV
jgi:ABC-type transport system involved in multi-copper enzyme maturation permease subunit